jgi:hypothetical protein
VVDDHPRARPQHGLAGADVIWHAPAEGGTPRYLALYQTRDPAEIGPIRSARLYLVAWAAEWAALFVHHGGAPNALRYLRRVDRRLVWNVDGIRYEGSVLRRDRRRPAPHNVYASSTTLRALGARLDAPAAAEPAWRFSDDAPPSERGPISTFRVDYPYNSVGYDYDPVGNRWLRTVDGRPHSDPLTGERVAPRTVVVLQMRIGRMTDTGDDADNVEKGRLEIRYIGSGSALVFRDGRVVEATWTKPSDEGPTRLRSRHGPLAGHPIPFLRGQVMLHVVHDLAEVAQTIESGRDAAPAEAVLSEPDQTSAKRKLRQIGHWNRTPVPFGT